MITHTRRRRQRLDGANRMIQSRFLVRLGLEGNTTSKRGNNASCHGGIVFDACVPRFLRFLFGCLVVVGLLLSASFSDCFFSSALPLEISVFDDFRTTLSPCSFSPLCHSSLSPLSLSASTTLQSSMLCITYLLLLHDPRSPLFFPLTTYNTMLQQSEKPTYIYYDDEHVLTFVLPRFACIYILFDTHSFFRLFLCSLLFWVRDFTLLSFLFLFSLFFCLFCVDINHISINQTLEHRSLKFPFV